MESGPPLRKRLGQHHLTRPEVCAVLVEWLRPAERLVLEIGPGGGVLSGQLASAGARVLGVERDLAWGFHLAEERLAGVRVVLADALEWPWNRLPKGALVAGNLPYNIATPLIRALLPHHRQVPRAGFLLQREVAERLTAGPGDAAYGALSLLVAARAEVVLLSSVGAGAFRPPPKVESAFVGLTLHPPPLEETEMEAFERLVHGAFGQRRKMLRNALTGLLGPEAENRLEAAEIDPRTRAETVGLEDYLRLFRSLRKRSQ